MAVHRFENRRGERQDARHQHKSRPQGIDALQQLALKTPPLPAAAVGKAVKNLSPQPGHARREGRNRRYIGHRDIVFSQLGLGCSLQQLGAQRF